MKKEEALRLSELPLEEINESEDDLREPPEQWNVRLPVFILESLRIVRKKYNSARRAQCIVIKKGIIDLSKDPGKLAKISKICEWLRKLYQRYPFDDNVIMKLWSPQEGIWKLLGTPTKRYTVRMYYWCFADLQHLSEDCGINKSDATFLTIIYGLKSSNKWIKNTRFYQICCDFLTEMEKKWDELYQEYRNSVLTLIKKIGDDLLGLGVANDTMTPRHTDTPLCLIYNIHDLTDLIDELSFDVELAQAARNIFKNYNELKELVEKKQEVGSFNEQMVREFYRFLAHSPDGYTEIRAIDPNDNRYPIQIFVKGEDELVYHCKRLDGKYQVYIGLQERRGKSGKLEDIAYVRVFFIDIDTERPKDLPANKEELDRALALANKVYLHLQNTYGAKPLLVMSGNGYHIYVAIPPIEVKDYEILNWQMQEFLRRYKEQFEGIEVRIDNVANLDRIAKVPGTKSIKGIASSDRPHRYATIISPMPIERVECEALEKAILNVKPEPVPYREPPRYEGYDRIEFPISSLISLVGMRKRGDEYYGSHPVHGSNTGMNFWVNVRKNVWHCFRAEHNSGGGPLELLAVLEGLIDCRDAKPGALRGELFKEVVEIARKRGLIK